MTVGGDLTGTTVLLAGALHRERWTVAWWTLGSVVLFVSQGVSVDRLYSSRAELAEAATHMAEQPALLAMTGPARALDTTGGQVAWQASAFGAVVAALLAMVLVVRHTRAQEESGHDELVRALPVGRYAAPAAAGLLALLAEGVLGTSVTLGLVLYGLPVAGSVAIGTGTAACGVLFAAVALLAAQVAATARAAYGLTGATIGAAYLVRAVGDVSGGGLSWLSPVGWAQAQRPYADERWWPLALFAPAVLGLTAGAVTALAHRDWGTGWLATRPGPASASPGLAGPWGLAWRLHRSSVGWWSVAIGVCGLAYGAAGNDIDALVGDSDLTTALLGASGESMTRVYLGLCVLILALAAAGFAVSSVLRVRAEERTGLAEAVLATGVTRWRWAGAHVAVTVAGSVAVLASGVCGLAAGQAAVSGHWTEAPGVLLGGAVQLVGVVCVTAVVWLAVAAVPSYAGQAGWGLLLGCWVVAFLGDVLRLPPWLRWWSPFEHLPRAPAETLVPATQTLVGPLGVGLVAALLVAAGALALRRRDLV